VRKKVVIFCIANGYIIYNGNVIAPKKVRVSQVFRNPSSPIPNLSTRSSNPDAREPISVAILFDLLGKKWNNDEKGKC
jgi:hypothetical protein